MANTRFKSHITDLLDHCGQILGRSLLSARKNFKVVKGFANEPKGALGVTDTQYLSLSIVFLYDLHVPIRAQDTEQAVWLRNSTLKLNPVSICCALIIMWLSVFT